MLALSSNFSARATLAWRCIKRRSNVNAVVDVETDAGCGILMAMMTSLRATNERSEEPKIGARLSEFIRINVCGRLIQGAAKRPGNGGGAAARGSPE